MRFQPCFRYIHVFFLQLWFFNFTNPKMHFQHSIEILNAFTAAIPFFTMTICLWKLCISIGHAISFFARVYQRMLSGLNHGIVFSCARLPNLFWQIAGMLQQQCCTRYGLYQLLVTQCDYEGRGEISCFTDLHAIYPWWFAPNATRNAHTPAATLVEHAASKIYVSLCKLLNCWNQMLLDQKGKFSSYQHYHWQHIFCPICSLLDNLLPSTYHWTETPD